MILLQLPHICLEENMWKKLEKIIEYLAEHRLCAILAYFIVVLIPFFVLAYFLLEGKK